MELRGFHFLHKTYRPFRVGDEVKEDVDRTRKKPWLQDYIYQLICHSLVATVRLSQDIAHCLKLGEGKH